MPPFSFIHAADLHLDSPFTGLGEIPENHSEVAEVLRDATLRAFENLVGLAIEREVDFLLIAGDVYNASDRSLRAQVSFRDGLRTLAQHGIRSYVIHGNHDPLDGRIENLELPEEAHVFGSSVESVTFEKANQPVARIHGVSYPKRDVGKRFGRGFKRTGPELFQVALFHCQVGAHPEHEPYAPRTVADLSRAELDYWALGHIHTREIIQEEDPFIAYSGNTQGRHINESGAKGCLLVRVDGNGKMVADPEFLPADVVRCFGEELDISGLGSIDDLEEAVDRLLDGVVKKAEGRAAVVRVSLTGRSAFHRTLARPGKAKEILEMAREAGLRQDPFVWIEKIRTRTQPEVDLDARRKGQDFLGDLLRMIESDVETQEFQDELRKRLDELYGHQRAGRFLEELTGQDSRSILKDAETVCVDRLTDEEA